MPEELPLYQSYKKVRAAKIVAIEDAGCDTTAAERTAVHALERHQNFAIY